MFWKLWLESMTFVMGIQCRWKIWRYVGGFVCVGHRISIDPAPNLCAGSGMLVVLFQPFCVTLIIVNLVIVSNGEAYLQVTPRLLCFIQCMVLKALGRI